MIKTGMFDCHCHTWNSPDSKSAPEELCKAAIEKGLSGIAFTDHCNVNHWPDVDVLSIVKASVQDARKMQEQFAELLTVLRGVELGNHIFNSEIVKRVLDMCDYDIVVGSVHAVKYKDCDKQIAKTDFSQFSNDFLTGYLEAYFKETMRMACEEDIDAVAHFSFGVRYMAYKNDSVINMSQCSDIIDCTLKQMIKRSIALEINANDVVPRKEILGSVLMTLDGREQILKVEQIDIEIAKRYYALGGRLITLGSDSHATDRVGRAFDKIVPMLKGIGFTEGYYFSNRQAKPYAF